MYNLLKDYRLMGYFNYKKVDVSTVLIKILINLPFFVSIEKESDRNLSLDMHKTFDICK